MHSCIFDVKRKVFKVVYDSSNDEHQIVGS